MVYILHGSERKLQSGYFEKLARLRHRIFIEERGWSLPSRAGLEIDQYDIENAVYFVDFDAAGEITAHVRLTPTVEASLIADYFPHLNETGQSSRDEKIYEATRFMVLPTQRDKSTARFIRANFMAAVIEWCIEQHLTHVQTVIDAGTLPTYLEISGLTSVMGLVHPFGGGKHAPGGGECCAFRWPIRQQLLDHIRAYGNLERPTSQPWQPLQSRVA